MSNSQTVDRNSRHQDQSRKLLWPVAVAVVLFTVSCPANDFYGASSPSDIGIDMLLVCAGIAAVTVGVVRAGAAVGTSSRGLRRSGAGTRAGGALLGWAGIYAAKGRRFTQAALL